MTPLNTTQITRADLREIVKHCTNVMSGELSPNAYHTLRKVAAETRYVAAGAWSCEGVGCPAAQAQARMGPGQFLNGIGSLWAEHYDAAIRDWLVVDQRKRHSEADGPLVLEVVD